MTSQFAGILPPKIMADAVWFHMCDREIMGFRSPETLRKQHRHLFWGQKEVMPLEVTASEAPSPKKVLPLGHAKLQNRRLIRPELNGSKVVTESGRGHSQGFPGFRDTWTSTERPTLNISKVVTKRPASVPVRLNMPRKAILDHLVLPDHSLPALTVPQGMDAVKAGKLAKAKSMGDVTSTEFQKQVAQKMNLRDAMEASLKTVPQKGWNAHYTEAGDQRSPSRASSASLSTSQRASYHRTERPPTPAASTSEFDLGFHPALTLTFRYM